MGDQLDVTGPRGSVLAGVRTAASGRSCALWRRRARANWSVDGLVGALASLRMESRGGGDRAGRPSDSGLDRPRTVRLGLRTARRARWRSAARRAEDVPRARVRGHRSGRQARSWWTTWRQGPGGAPGKRLLEVATYEVTSIEAQAGAVKRSVPARARRTRKGSTIYRGGGARRPAPAAVDATRCGHAVRGRRAGGPGLMVLDWLRMGSTRALAARSAPASADRRRPRPGSESARRTARGTPPAAPTTATAVLKWTPRKPPSWSRASARCGS